MRVLTALLLLALVAAAGPPQSKDYARMNDLLRRLGSRYEALVRQEEFEKKPRVEKILISYGRGEKRFEKFSLTGENVVKVVFDWDEVKKTPPGEEADRVLKKLVQVLTKRYARALDVPKRERYKASVLLVKALTDPRLHVRQAAIDSLKGIYRLTHGHFYQADQEAKELKKKQKTWTAYIKRVK